MSRFLAPFRSSLLIAASVLLAGPVSAQRNAPVVSFDAGGVFATLSGNDLKSTGDGLGFEGQVNLGVGAFGIGAGYSRTTHDIVGASNNATMTGEYLEPRLALPFAYRDFTPYLLGRVGMLQYRLDDSAGAITASGSQLGGGIGMLVRIAPTMQLNVGTMMTSLHFNDAERDGSAIAGSAANGVAVSFRAGLSIGAGRWGVK